VSGSTTGFPTLAAILLAAGSSRRFGTENKLLADVDGMPLVRRVGHVLVIAGFELTVVVTGHQAEAIQIALLGLRGSLRRFVHNAAHDEGMGRSIAVGMAVVPPTVDGVLIAQGDMPDLNTTLITTLCQRFIDAGSDRIVVPWLESPGLDDRVPGGRQGNPVIWPRRLFPELAALSGDEGAKPLIRAAGDATVRVAVSDSSAATDIDTPEQLNAYNTAAFARAKAKKH
jgi:molybdenum cofactor cytidylyltransferase